MESPWQEKRAVLFTTLIQSSAKQAPNKDELEIICIFKLVFPEMPDSCNFFLDISPAIPGEREEELSSCLPQEIL